MTSTFTSVGQAEAGTSAGRSHGAGHSVPSSPETQIQPDSSGLRRFAALDGMRAFAVMAVMLFHFGVSWVGGGLLGVDVFFVLSGFLITTLLCRELSRTTTIALGRFWAQRARRLLPALFVLIVGVAAYAFAFSNTIDVSGVRSDAIATLAYVANWHFIISGQGYFAQAAAPSPLLHTWSLAVEEQYYLIWPLIALFVVRRWGMAKLAVTAGVGALASAALMGSLFAAGFSVDRIYYGTDTRAQALLVGSFLGAVGSHAGEHFTIVPARWTRIRHSGLVWALPGVAGALFLVWAWHALNGQDPFLYHGGFLLVAVAAGAVIVTCVTVPASAVPRFFSLGVLVFIGRISYGLYLYHWPLFLIINHAHTGLLGFPLLAARLAATFAVAIASWYLIEEPVRTGRFFRHRRALALGGVVTLVMAGLVLVATVAPTGTTATIPASAAGFDSGTAQRPVTGGAAAVAADTPVHFLLLGDSVALTMGLGLSVDSVSTYHVNVADEGTLGCDLDNVDVLQGGVVTPATPGCPDWRTTWPTEVSFFRADVVGLLIGRWEVTDHFYDGQWVHVGDPVWDDHLLAELNQAVGIFSAHGAKVVLFTMPYMDPSQEAANGQPFVENDPARAAAFNQLLRQVAKEHPAVVSVVDLNKLLDPHGSYQAAIDGVTVRDSDGVHISIPGGEWLRSSILPTIAALGCTVAHTVATTSGSTGSTSSTGSSSPSGSTSTTGPAAATAGCIS